MVLEIWPCVLPWGQTEVCACIVDHRGTMSHQVLLHWDTKIAYLGWRLSSVVSDKAFACLCNSIFWCSCPFSNSQEDENVSVNFFRFGFDRFFEGTCFGWTSLLGFACNSSGQRVFIWLTPVLLFAMRNLFSISQMKIQWHFHTCLHMESPFLIIL